MNGDDIRRFLRGNDRFDPLEIMADHGFEEYVEAADRVLPDDWGSRYNRSPKTIAAGLTYYVALNGYTQVEVADAYDVSLVTVRNGYSLLPNDVLESD